MQSDLGKGLANPTALLLSSLMMLRYVSCELHRATSDDPLSHMNLNEYADKIEKAALTVRPLGYFLRLCLVRY